MSNNEPAPTPPWTVLKTLQWTTDYFRQNGIESPRLAAEVLLAHALKRRRIDLYLHHDQPLQVDELSGYKQLIRRRLRHEPVAYILGTKEFRSIDFQVNPDVLIPRPETEQLVDAALDFLSEEDPHPKFRVFEPGTGSGAVIVALATERPGCTFWASDVSVKAVRVAQSNARRILSDGGVHFVAGDWFGCFRPGKAMFDLIVSNPPYVSAEAFAALEPEIRGFEPKGALLAGNDGLSAIRRIIEEAPHFLLPRGCLMLEIGYDQQAAVEALGRRTGAYDRISFRKDYSGHDRVAVLSKAAG